MQKQQLELDIEQQTGSKSGKEYVKAVYCHPPYLIYTQRHHPYGRKWRRAKGPFLKEESETVGLKLNIQKSKIMASGPITLWQIDRETVETVTDFILGGSKITADGDCSHEIKRSLLLGMKVRPT